MLRGDDVFMRLYINNQLQSDFQLYENFVQALGYVHGAQIIHAPEPIHGRLR